MNGSKNLVEPRDVAANPVTGQMAGFQSRVAGWVVACLGESRAWTIINRLRQLLSEHGGQPSSATGVSSQTLTLRKSFGHLQVLGRNGKLITSVDPVDLLCRDHEFEIPPASVEHVEQEKIVKIARALAHEIVATVIPCSWEDRNKLEFIYNAALASIERAAKQQREQ